MKIKHYFSLLVAVTFLSAGVAKADFYAGIGFGGSFNDGAVKTDGVKTSYKDTPVYNLLGGYELPLPLLDIRGEAEILYMKPKVKIGDDRKLQAVMANAVAVVPFIPLIDPYVGAGMGYVRFDHNNAIAVQGILGVEYELPIAPIIVGGEYRYFKVNETSGKANSESKFHTNMLMLKLKYLF